MVVGAAGVKTVNRAVIGGLMEVTRCAAVVKTKLVVGVDKQGPKSR